MKFSNLLSITAVITFVYGASYELVPRIILPLYGITQGPGEIFLGRLFGAALIGISLVAWLSRNIPDIDTQRAITLALLVSNIVGFIVAVHGTITGAMNAVGWTAVAVFLFLMLSYAYFQFMNPSNS